MKKPVTFYLRVIGNGDLNRYLAERMNDQGEKLFEHPAMECLLANNQKTALPLWEVPKHVKEDVVGMAKGKGFEYILFVKRGDGLPKETSPQAGLVRLIPVDPFKAGRKKRRAQGLPRGVFWGSSLPSMAPRQRSKAAPGNGVH